MMCLFCGAWRLAARACGSSGEAGECSPFSASASRAAWPVAKVKRTRNAKATKDPGTEQVQVTIWSRKLRNHCLPEFLSERCPPCLPAWRSHTEPPACPGTEMTEAFCATEALMRGSGVRNPSHHISSSGVREIKPLALTSWAKLSLRSTSFQVNAVCQRMSNCLSLPVCRTSSSTCSGTLLANLVDTTPLPR